MQADSSRSSYTTGDGNDVELTILNAAPTVSDIANQTVNEDTPTAALGFTVSDFETAPGSLVVSGQSSNTTIVPNANIVYLHRREPERDGDAGRGSERRPAHHDDHRERRHVLRQRHLRVTVNAVNDAPTITAIANQTANANAIVGPLPFTVGDIDSAVAGLTVSGTSSNPTLVPDANIAFGGAGANRNVTITPLPDQAGQTTVTITVSDGSTPMTTSFLLNVRRHADSLLPHQSRRADRISRRRSTASRTRRS